MRKQHLLYTLLLLVLLCLLSACSFLARLSPEISHTDETGYAQEPYSEAPSEWQTQSAPLVSENSTEQVSTSQTEQTQAFTSQTEQTLPAQSAHIVAIDPGHQLHGDYETEPVGPGASEQKARVSSGTQGRTTGVPEYELNLQVSLLLRDELEQRGYTVILTRDTNDVSISNAERAAIANEAGAEILVRIHANGSEDASVSGAMTICMTPDNPYNGELFAQSYALSDAILTYLCGNTGAKQRNIWQTDTMTGINYSLIPVTIVEMGYMTNPDEDRLLASDAYRELLAEGIANGIDFYFEEKP